MKPVFRRRLAEALVDPGRNTAWQDVLAAHGPPEILDVCDRWRVSGLAYRRLIAPAERHLPGELVEPFRGRYGACAAANLIRKKRLAEIDRAFAEAGIIAVVAKGMALVEQVYADPGVREMSDTDLLVPDSLDAATDVLRALGYQQDKGHPTVFVGSGNILDVKDEPFGVARIAPRQEAFAGSLVALFEGTTPLEGYTQLRSWAPAARLYTLCVHGLKHGFPDGVWLVDIGEVVTRMSAAGWREAVRLFVRGGNAEVLQVAMQRISDFGYGLPAHVADWSRSRPRSRGFRHTYWFARHDTTSFMAETVYLAGRQERLIAAVSCVRLALFPNQAVFDRLGVRGPAGARGRFLRMVDVVSRALGATTRTHR